MNFALCVMRVVPGDNLNRKLHSYIFSERVTSVQESSADMEKPPLKITGYGVTYNKRLLPIR